MEDAQLVGFEEGLSAARVSTDHGVETKGQIPIGFVCKKTFQKYNLDWSGCQTMSFYVRLESYTQESEFHFEYNNFNGSS